MDNRQSLNRRSFLKGCAQTVGSLGLAAFAPFPEKILGTVGSPQASIGVGRVAAALIYVYREPAFTSERIGKYTRDELIALAGTMLSPSGPSANPNWYRLADGYVHSGRIQRIPLRSPNVPLKSVPAEGVLGEITVPFSSSYRFSSAAGWTPLYRLYYESLHWVKGIGDGPDGSAWYRITDSYPQAEYFVPAREVRPLSPQEFSPVSVEVPADEKRIVISLGRQSLTAFEGNRIVYKTSVSTGVHTENLPEGELPTDTPEGTYRIQLKMPSRHMGDGRLTSDPSAYELPGVPWTMVFHKDGIALHGTYWHNNFGTKMSHGCVNLRNADARWLFRWTEPVYDPANWYTRGVGTLVQVRT